jgi:hypothetical protein
LLINEDTLLCGQGKCYLNVVDLKEFKSVTDVHVTGCDDIMGASYTHEQGLIALACQTGLYIVKSDGSVVSTHLEGTCLLSISYVKENTFILGTLKSSKLSIFDISTNQEVGSIDIPSGNRTPRRILSLTNGSDVSNAKNSYIGVPSNYFLVLDEEAISFIDVANTHGAIVQNIHGFLNCGIFVQN